LTSINLPEGLQTIGNSAFANSGVMNVHIPSTITHIGDWAFGWASSLQTVHIGTNSQLQHIGSHAFHGSPVRSIFIPHGVLDFAWGYGMNWLEGIYVPENHVAFYSRNGILYNRMADGNFSFRHIPNFVSGNIEIPYGVTTIPREFRNREGIRQVTIPSS